MLFRLILFLFGFCGGYSINFAQDTLKENYLELSCRVTEAKASKDFKLENVVWAKIEIYQANVLIGNYLTNKKGKVSFKVPLQNKYTIRVSKPGYVPKIIEVDTRLNEVILIKKGKYKPYYYFPFEVDIFEEISGLNVDVLKKPIAKISYNYSSYSFAYDVSYTSRINYELKKMYKDYYMLLILQQDSLNDNPKLPSAEENN